jgi:hypothetical protein
MLSRIELSMLIVRQGIVKRPATLTRNLRQGIVRRPATLTRNLCVVAVSWEADRIAYLADISPGDCKYNWGFR